MGNPKASHSTVYTLCMLFAVCGSSMPGNLADAQPEYASPWKLQLQSLPQVHICDLGQQCKQAYACFPMAGHCWVEAFTPSLRHAEPRLTRSAVQGFAYIEFLEADAVASAVLLSDTELHGRQLKVRSATKPLAPSTCSIVRLLVAARRCIPLHHECQAVAACPSCNASASASFSSLRLRRSALRGPTCQASSSGGEADLPQGGVVGTAGVPQGVATAATEAATGVPAFKRLYGGLRASHNLSRAASLHIRGCRSTSAGAARCPKQPPAERRTETTLN